MRPPSSVGRNAQSCIDDEREAKDSLTKTWLQYSRAHQSPCLGMTTRGVPLELYAELISCLEIMKDAAAIYKTDPLFGNLEKTPMKPTQPANRSTKTISFSAPPL